MVVERVPRCPDCGEPGKLVKGNHYRCPDCKAVWEERGWTDRITEELDALAMSEKMRGVNSLVSIIDCACDNCGGIIKEGTKYCYNSNEAVQCDESEVFYSAYPTRGKRYCVSCSLKAGYLKMVRNSRTDEEYPVMLMTKDEVIIRK